MKETFLLRMPKALKEWLIEDAKQQGLTLTGLVVSILNEYQRQRKQKGA
nr:hypothetical protein [Phascolarctobacterium sp.]